HDRADAHRAQTIEPLAHPALHNVLEINRAKYTCLPVLTFGNDEGCPSLARNALNDCVDLAWNCASILSHPFRNGVSRAFAEPGGIEIHAAHPGDRREWNKLHLTMAFTGADIPATQFEPVLRQNHDAAPFGRFIGER